jgi:ParB family chromosome partitioning protein
MALVENIQRQDLDPIEIALSYQRLIDEINLTQEKLSERVGKKRSTIANYMRLLKLDPIIQTGMRDGFLSMGHGRALVNIENKDDQIALYEKIIGQRLSVRETENAVKVFKEISEGKPAKKKAKETPEFINDGAQELVERLSVKVAISTTGKSKGKITIPFHSEEEFKRIKKLITGV